jgi:hypothetical protein
LEVEMQVAANGRVRRSEEEWKELLSRWGKSGTSAREFCRKEGLQFSSLLRWQRRLSGSRSESQFVSVVAVPPPASSPSSWTMEVTLPNGAKLRFQG